MDELTVNIYETKILDIFLTDAFFNVGRKIKSLF